MKMAAKMVCSVNSAMAGRKVNIIHTISNHNRVRKVLVQRNIVKITTINKSASRTRGNFSKFCLKLGWLNFLQFIIPNCSKEQMVCKKRFTDCHTQR
jgi:hypothetical protein